MNYSAGDIIIWTGEKHKRITLDQLAKGPSRYFYRVMGFTAKGQKPLVYRYKFERIDNGN